jgi:hypothetical protein
MQYKLHSIAIASLALALPMPAGSPAGHGAVAAAKPPFQTATWIGSNYTPAYAANQIQMWHEFKPEVIERELAAAVKYFGINTLRVYLHNIVYDAEKQPFLERIEAFLKICDRHGIKPGFVFFDDCWNHAGITIDTAPPVDGRHNRRCPRAARSSCRRREASPSRGQFGHF